MKPKHKKELERWRLEAIKHLRHVADGLESGAMSFLRYRSNRIVGFAKYDGEHTIEVDHCEITVDFLEDHKL